MEMYESIAWIAIGFIPTLLTMELAYKVAKGFKIHGRKEIALTGKTTGGLVKL